MLLSPDKAIGLVLASIGTIAIALSIILEQTILVFIGLTFIFWGILFSLVLPRKHVGNEVMNYMSLSSLSAIDGLINSSNMQGKPHYIPVPKGLRLPYNIGFEKEFIYIPPQEVKTEIAMEQALSNRLKGLRIIPPGQALVDFMEKKHKISFYEISLISLINILPSIIKNELEIADDIIIHNQKDIVETEIIKPLYENLCKEANKLTRIFPHIGCPIESAVACILTRITNRPIAIEECIIENKKIMTKYRIINP